MSIAKSSHILISSKFVTIFLPLNSLQDTNISLFLLPWRLVLQDKWKFWNLEITVLVFTIYMISKAGREFDSFVPCNVWCNLFWIIRWILLVKIVSRKNRFTLLLENKLVDFKVLDIFGISVVWEQAPSVRWNVPEYDYQVKGGTETEATGGSS